MRLALALICIGCITDPVAAAPADPPGAPATGGAVEVPLEADLAHVSLRQLDILRQLLGAARIMAALHEQQQAPGGFYPADMSREEFETWSDPAAFNPYTRIMRNADGALAAVPYHEAWPRELGHAARLLARAAEITTDEALRSYLALRARGLITGDHARAEAAWQATRGSDIDVLIGPIDREADHEFGLKAGFGAYVLLRDWAWGARLAQLKVFLPKVQHSLPVSAAFKGEVPDVNVKLAVYDLLYQAGHQVLQLHQEPRGVQLRNVVRAHYDTFIPPVAELTLAPELRRQVSFDAFFLNTMLHEMAHSLGLSRTIDDRSTVSAALYEHADTIEEAKAAVLSLWMIDWLHREGELTETTRSEHHASFLAGVVHDIHLDPWSPVGQARLLLFNYFRDWGAFRRDAAGGGYYIDELGMGQAIEILAGQLLTLQGSGDHDGAAGLVETLAGVRPELRADLERLRAAGVPSSIVFRQAPDLPGM